MPIMWHRKGGKPKAPTALEVELEAALRQAAANDPGFKKKLETLERMHLPPWLFRAVRAVLVGFYAYEVK